MALSLGGCGTRREGLRSLVEHRKRAKKCQVTAGRLSVLFRWETGPIGAVETELLWGGPVTHPLETPIKTWKILFYRRLEVVIPKAGVSKNQPSYLD